MQIRETFWSVALQEVELKHWKGTVKVNGREQEMTCRAPDINSAKRLFEQQGKLLYVPKMIPG